MKNSSPSSICISKVNLTYTFLCRYTFFCRYTAACILCAGYEICQFESCIPFIGILICFVG